MGTETRLAANRPAVEPSRLPRGSAERPVTLPEISGESWRQFSKEFDNLTAGTKNERTPRDSTGEVSRGTDRMLVFDDFPLKGYVHERLAKTIADAEKKLVESGPRNVIEYYNREVLSPAEYQQHEQRLAGEREENVIQSFQAAFFAYLTAHLDSRRDYRGMRAVLPLVYHDLLDRTFFRNWLTDRFGDRDFEQARFRDRADRAVADSPEWRRFLGVLDQLARKEGSPETPGTLPFLELVEPRDRLQDSIPEALPQKETETLTRKLPEDGVSTGTSEFGFNLRGGRLGAENRHVSLLLQIVAAKNITVETWARDNTFGRTTVFDWKAARAAGASPKGKVSPEKCAAIEEAIEKDAEALGLIPEQSTRTEIDSNSD